MLYLLWVQKHRMSYKINNIYNLYTYAWVLSLGWGEYGYRFLSDWDAQKGKSRLLRFNTMTYYNDFKEQLNTHKGPPIIRNKPLYLALCW